MPGTTGTPLIIELLNKPESVEAMDGYCNYNNCCLGLPRICAVTLGITCILRTSMVIESRIHAGRVDEHQNRWGSRRVVFRRYVEAQYSILREHELRRSLPDSCPMLSPRSGIAYVTSGESEDAEEARKLKQKLWDNRYRRMRRWAIIAGSMTLLGAAAAYKSTHSHGRIISSP